MLRRLGVRGKILATLAVPVLVLFLGATLVSVGAVADSRLASATRQVVASLRAQDKLTLALQAERTAAFDYTLKRDGAEADFLDAQRATDVAVATLDTEVRKINLGPLDERLVDAIADAKTARSVAELSRVRALFVGADTVLTKTVEVQYGMVIDAQMRVADIAADRMPDRDLGRLFQTYNAVDRSIDRTSLDSKLGEILLADYMADKATDRSLRNVAVEITNGDLTRLQAETLVKELDLPGVEMPVEFVTYSIVRGALSNASPGSTTVTSRMTWPQLAEAEVNAIIPVRDVLRDRTMATADSNSTNQTRQTALTIGIVALALAASTVIALLVARRITEPLRRLTAAATHVRDELPKLVDQVAVPGQGPELEFERIPVEDNDEVGQLAAAFNEVNETTIDIAREQALLRGSIAEMFVNVARRDQVLLSRQLTFLDELERSEEDPNTLANLFRLDHLATRMRRNAESLLVLAGIESGRRVRDPMPLSDVIRTAASEIEQYDRVQLEIQTDPHMLGHNALVAAHLLAELLENATVYSDPGSPVFVSESEDSRWVTILVQDQGLGMTPEEIDEANEKASTYAGGEIAGQSRLGLYVVGRLSYKLGAVVRFRNLEEDGKVGTEARVMLPRELFLADSEVPLHEPIDPLSAQTQAAAEAWVSPESPLTGDAPFEPQLVEEEPPVAVPVDLNALTDGATASGMPRRRSRAADASAPAPSQALSSAADDRDRIILPPLQQADLPSSFGEDDGAWAPISVPEPAGSGLPSRAPTQSAPSAEATPEFVPPAPVPKRASMFSNFRTRKDLDDVTAGELASEDTPGQQEQALTPITELDIQRLPTRTARRQARSAASAASAFTSELAIVPAPEAAQPQSDTGGNRSDAPVQRFEIPNLETAEHAAEGSPARPGVQEDSAPVQRFEIPGLVEDQPLSDSYSAGQPEQQYEPVGLVPDEQFMPQQNYASDVDGVDTAFVNAPFHDAPAGGEAGAPDGAGNHPYDGGHAQPGEPNAARISQYDAPAHAEAAPLGASPFADAILPDAEESLPDFAELVGRSARREAEQPKRRGLFGRKRTSSRKTDKSSKKRGEQAAQPQPQGSGQQQITLPPMVDRSQPAPLTGFSPLGSSPIEPAPTARAAGSGQYAAGPQHFEPQSFEPQPVEPQSFEPQPVEPQSYEPQPVEAQSFQPQSFEPESFQPPTSPEAPGGDAFLPEGEPTAVVEQFGNPAAAPEPVTQQGFAPLSGVGPGVRDGKTAAGFFSATRRASGRKTSALPSRRGHEPAAPEAAAATPASAGSGLPPETNFTFTPQMQEQSWAPSLGFGDQPTSGEGGSLDPSAQLALRAGIQEQALSELSQLSAYRPNQMGSGSGGSLTRRVRSDVPDSTDDISSQKISRDAAELRARLSAFMSATNRARETPDDNPTDHAGAEVTFGQATPDPAPQSN